MGGLKLRWGELSGNRVDRDWWVGQGLVARIRSAGRDKGCYVGQRLVGRSCGWTGAGGRVKG